MPKIRFLKLLLYSIELFSLLGYTRHKVVLTDVLGLPIGDIFKSQAVQTWPLKMGPIGSPETSVYTSLCRIITQKTE